MQVAPELGAQVVCIDAPLKLQEGWVRQMLARFELNESQLAMQVLWPVWLLWVAGHDGAAGAWALVWPFCMHASPP